VEELCPRLISNTFKCCIEVQKDIHSVKQIAAASQTKGNTVADLTFEGFFVELLNYLGNGIIERKFFSIPASVTSSRSKIDAGEQFGQYSSLSRCSIIIWFGIW